VRATLIYPPIGDPRAPQLALPSLAAVLRRAGIETDLEDLNIAGILALLRPDRVRRAARVLAARSGEGDDALSRLAARAAELGTDAIATLHGERFYDANEYNAARDTVFTALEAAGAAASTPVQVGLFPTHYDISGMNTQLLSDLIKATSNNASNIFAEHWEEEVFPRLVRSRPDFIGITITNRQQILPGLMLARSLRQRGHFVVIGGTVYTKFVDQLREKPDFFRTFADGVVVYEGETAILALADELAGSCNFNRIPNYLHLAGGRVRMGPIKVENVEELPTPDFSGLPLSEYLTPTPVLPILTGKGCYFNRCKFCEIPFINHVAQKNYRVRSPQKIVADVQELSRRFNSNHFVITDEALAPKLLEDLAEAFEHAGGAEHYSFTGYARLEAGFTPELCLRLHRMGLRKLFFGMESAAQETLDKMDKGTKAHEAPTVLSNCRNAGIAFHVFSIIGFPDENEDSARKTFQFFLDNKHIVDHPANSFDIHLFGLELRTDYFNEYESHGIVISQKALTHDFPIGISSRDWTNTRGLSKERVADLIENEFYPQLRRVYREYHNMRGQLWPGFEEYAMLYGDHYLDRPFPFVTSVQSFERTQTFRLRLNPNVVASRVKGMADSTEVVLTNLTAAVTMPIALYSVLADSTVRSFNELVYEKAEPGTDVTLRDAQLRQDLDSLIEHGFVQVMIVGN